MWEQPEVISVGDQRNLNETQRKDFFSEQHSPLFALKKAYASESKVDNAQLVNLWVQLIESELMINVPFFSQIENQNLFIRLKPLAERIITTNLSFKQIKGLGIALALYRATRFEIDVLDCSKLSESKIDDELDSYWAENFLYRLLYNKVAYIKGTEMDFESVIRFLDFGFIPNVGFIRFARANLEINFDHLFKLIHVFQKLFLIHPIDFNKTPDFSIEQPIKYPPFFDRVLKLMDIDEYVDMPDDIPKPSKEKIVKAMNSGSLKIELMRAVDDKADEAVPVLEEKLHTLKTKAYFIRQFYLAYCKLNADKELAGLEGIKRPPLTKEVSFRPESGQDDGHRLNVSRSTLSIYSKSPRSFSGEVVEETRCSP